MGLWRAIVHGIGLNLGWRAVDEGLRRLSSDDEEERRRREEKRRKKRLLGIGLVVGSAFGLLLLLALLAKLLKWLLALGLLAGVGAGAYLLAKPKVAELLAARREEREAKARERALLERARSLEDELEALKRRSQDG